ncbi:hypothetical protein ViNHUV68_19690 [Vibrio sp. NH-UV-68]
MFYFLGRAHSNSTLANNINRNFCNFLHVQLTLMTLEKIVLNVVYAKLAT